MVKKGNGRYSYEVRDHGGATGLASEDALNTLNIRERKAFMDGKKKIGIISDAASTGISLHSATTVKYVFPSTVILSNHQKYNA